MYKFSSRSLKNLEGVHPDLVRVVNRALELSSTDFTVIEGVRDMETQLKYLARGTSRTLKSRHLLQPDGYGHAVDIYPYYNGSVQVHAPYSKFELVAHAMKTAAAELGVRITWGGDWKALVDGPHYQIELS